jgi:hypothetical protein
MLRVVNIQTEKVIDKVKLNAKLFAYDIAYSGDGKFFAVGFATGMIKIFTA